MSIGRVGFSNSARSSGQQVADPYALPPGFPTPIARWIAGHPNNVLDPTKTYYSKIADVTGNGHDAVPEFPNYLTAYAKVGVNNLIEFPTTSGYDKYLLSNPINLIQTSDFTISLWINGLIAGSANNRLYISFSNVSNSIALVSSSNLFGVVLGNNLWNNANNTTASIQNATGTFSLLVIKSYIDNFNNRWITADVVDNSTGQVSNLVTRMLSAPWHGANITDIMCGYSTSSTTFPLIQTQLGDMMVVNSAVTAQDILNYYNATKATYGL